MWSAPVLITAPVSEPVTLDAAKEFLSIEPDEVLNDAQIARFIAAARSHVEDVTATRLMPQTVQIGASWWTDLARFPIGPVIAVDEVSWTDFAGVDQLLNLDDFELFGQGLERGLRAKAGVTLPSGLRRGRDAIRVTLQVGYADVPPSIHSAILIMVADQFAQRESFISGTIAAKVPSSMQVDALLSNHRIWL